MKASLLALLATASISNARLFENSDELKQRYGNSVPKKGELTKPLILNSSRRDFIKNGIRISVIIYDGKSVCEIFSAEEGLPLSSSQKLAIIQANLHRTPPYSPLEYGLSDGTWVGSKEMAIMVGEKLEIISDFYDKAVNNHNESIEEKRINNEAKSVEGF